MIKTVSIAACTALAAATLVFSTGAAAQERDTRTTGVTYQDLDLSTEQGRAELDRRIDSAAKQVCGVNERQLGSNIMSRETRTCYRSTKRNLERHFAEIVANQNRAG